MDFDALYALQGTSQEEFERIREGIIALTRPYWGWEEKIENLVELAKAAGRFIESRDEQGTDYNNESMYNLREAYEEFCQWRHDEPYVVDEIKGLLEGEAYIDEVTGIRLRVKQDNPEYPGHPKITVAYPNTADLRPRHTTLPVEQINEAFARLRRKAGLSSEMLPDLYWIES